MQEDKWVYQIGKDSLAVIFPLIGLAISGGVAIALALANNPAVFLIGLFALFMLVMTLMGLYRRFGDDVDGAVSPIHCEVPGG